MTRTADPRAKDGIRPSRLWQMAQSLSSVVMRTEGEYSSEIVAHLRYVSTHVQNNPTYEFYPKKGGAVNMDFLSDTVPLNLFPLTWLLPSGQPILHRS